MLIFCARERVPINVIGLQLNPENCLSQQLSSLMLKKGKKFTNHRTQVNSNIDGSLE